MFQLKDAMPHCDKHFDPALDGLRKRVQGLGNLVNKQISLAIAALLGQEADLARVTIANDHLVNRLEVGIEEDCIEMLALRQPIGDDLRFVTAAIKIVDNLERMGNLAVNICERVIEMEREPHIDDYYHIRKVGGISKSMIRDGLTSFMTNDIFLAEIVRMRDKEVDMLTELNQQLLLISMIENPSTIGCFTRAMFIAKYLERIADYAKTMAGHVIYMVNGNKARNAE